MKSLGQPIINASGTIVHQGDLLGQPFSSDNLIMLGTPAQGLDPIAAEGTNAPGAGVGAVFSGSFQIGAQYFNDGLLVNNAHEVLYRDSLIGTGVLQTNNAGLWRRTGGSSVSGLITAFPRSHDPNRAGTTQREEFLWRLMGLYQAKPAAFDGVTGLIVFKPRGR